MMWKCENWKMEKLENEREQEFELFVGLLSYNSCE
jgi:hypothetical protein